MKTKKKDGERRVLDVQEKAEELDRKLLATDPRLNGSVLVMHMDGSFMLFDRAFALLYQKDFAIILTEHHGPHWYCLEDLTHLRALGSRLHIGNVEEPVVAPIKPKVDMDKIAKGLGATRRGKVTANGGFHGALQTAAEAKNKSTKKR